MNRTEAMPGIEGYYFSTMVNLASDFRTFLRILWSQPEVRALAEAMASEETTRDVFVRSLDLVEAQADQAYEHPADAALAAYLLLLSARDGEFSEILAEIVLESKQFWWARKVAELVRKASGFHSGAGSKSSVLTEGTVAVDYTAHAESQTVPLHALIQRPGRVRRVEPGPAQRGVVVYPITPEELPAYFRNQGTQNRLAEVPAGRE